MNEEVPAEVRKLLMTMGTVAELKTFLNNPTTERRMKFAVRVFHVLQWTHIHPEEVFNTGAVWCNDGRHFLCNSKIIGDLLNIRPNTINTNFRSHSFSIENTQPHIISSDFPILKDTKNWRKRVNNHFNFCITANESEISKIPCKDIVEAQKIAQQITISFPPPQPPSRRNILTNSNVPMPPTMKYKYECKSSQESQEPIEFDKDISSIFSDMKGTIDQKKAIHNKALEYWRNFNNSESMSPEILTRIMLKDVELQKQIQVSRNINNLLKMDTGVSESEITFAHYFKFFAQYGDPNTVIKTVSEATDPKDNNEFLPWFQPRLSQIGSERMLMSVSGPEWLVRCSSTKVGMFTLQIKDGGEIKSIHIDFNPLIPSFSLVCEAFGLVQDSSLYTLLFDKLNLRQFKGNHSFINESESIRNSAFSSQQYFVESQN